MPMKKKGKFSKFFEEEAGELVKLGGNQDNYTEAFMMDGKNECSNHIYWLP